MDGEILAAPTVITLLQCLLFSALATDRYQTAHAIEGTLEDPIALPTGDSLLWEGNPLLAGRPYMLDPYFDFLEALAEGIPRMLSPPWDSAVLMMWALGQIGVVQQNNTFAASVGLPQYTVLAYRFRW